MRIPQINMQILQNLYLHILNNYIVFFIALEFNHVQEEIRKLYLQYLN